jgi:hypothetical protein
MNNIRYPSFEFDKWLNSYIVAMAYADGLEQTVIKIFGATSLLEYSDYSQGFAEEFKEKKEEFLAQKHTHHYEDFSCLACEYLQEVANFNKFMIVIQSTPVCEFSLVVEHFREQIPVNKRNDECICKYASQLLDELEIPYDRTAKMDI